jgi:hypothetical protein
MAVSSDRALRDPLEAVLRRLHVAAVAQLGHVAAQSYVLNLVGQAREVDKLTAARVVLTDRS